MKKVAHTAFIPTGNIRYALQITPYGVGRFLLYPILVFAMLNLQAQGKVAPKKLVTHKKVPVLIYSRKQGIQRYYHWLSSKEFCWIEPIGSSASEHRVISYRLDKKAKFQRAIVNRNILYHGFDGDTVDPWTFSPDGRYLLCFDRDKPFTFRRLYDLVSRPVVEHRFQDAFSASERNLLWMPSAKQWAEISLDGGSIFVQIRSLQGESIHEVYASGDLRKTTLLGITSEKTLLLLKNDYSALLHISLQDTSPSLKKYKPPLPLNSDYIDFVELAVQGNFLLWTQITHKRPAGKLLFSPEKLSGNPAEFEWVQYYISEIDGAHMRSLGIAPLARSNSKGPFDWEMIIGKPLPDGKSFSFYFQGDMFQVPISDL